jgi:thioesterase superfamily protein 4
MTLSVHSEVVLGARLCPTPIISLISRPGPRCRKSKTLGFLSKSRLGVEVDAGTVADCGLDHPVAPRHFIHAYASPSANSHQPSWLLVKQRHPQSAQLTMEGTAMERMLSIPWAAALINDPKWTHTRTGSRLPKASGEDSFFAETLATDRTLRACLTLVPTKKVHGKLVYQETCQGGVAATLLDEICGVLIQLNTEMQLVVGKQSGSLNQARDVNYMTACKLMCGTKTRCAELMSVDLNISYKRPIPTPSTVLCTAKVERQDGRKLYIRATIEDGAGVIYTVGEAMFVEIKSRL